MFICKKEKKEVTNIYMYKKDYVLRGIQENTNERVLYQQIL